MNPNSLRDRMNEILNLPDDDLPRATRHMMLPIARKTGNLGDTSYPSVGNWQKTSAMYQHDPAGSEKEALLFSAAAAIAYELRGIVSSLDLADPGVYDLDTARKLLRYIEGVMI